MTMDYTIIGSQGPAYLLVKRQEPHSPAATWDPDAGLSPFRLVESFLKYGHHWLAYEGPQDALAAKVPDDVFRDAPERINVNRYADLDTLIQWQVDIINGKPKPDDLMGVLSDAYDQFKKKSTTPPGGAWSTFRTTRSRHLDRVYGA